MAVFDGGAHQVERDGALGRRDAVGLHVAEGVLWRHEVQVDIVLVSLAEGGDRTLGDAEHRMNVTLVQAITGGGSGQGTPRRWHGSLEHQPPRLYRHDVRRRGRDVR
ncbi:MAG: hypothetical protein OXC62_09130 [Aestuariivita sp.]|nr:hypothetical protein [Aestuariivita sp.]